MGKHNIIDTIIKLIQCGWRVYEGQATAAVYDNLDCDERNRRRARWFAKGEMLICAGCPRACSLNCPEGFQVPLFKYPPPPKPVFRLNPEQLLANRRLLNVKEAAYILNVSPRRLRNMIHEGKFRVAADTPLRIPVEEIKAALRNIDYWTSEGERKLDQKAGQI